MGPYLGKYAFKMLLRQHELATGPNASYETSNADNGVTILTNTKIGESHEVNARTCLLPCRHVMYARAKSNYKTVLPPMTRFPTR
ncbi:hypothetical protein F442_01918 [Phytophthora nicotianae P10297]|uniref:Uncharacterized protein n=1 Tax=Phytophthora nicotianae P10297 TaxID=1317064 RepID=W3A3P4_PHYNI|nr:hypothetical protein F442_01918 [Phytophthora nicotianae P10297]